jgi:hypothetical protein
MRLGRFEKVELRECWRTEDKDFTPWLAKPENIEILSESIGVTLEVQAVEQFVGPFRADILCVDADSFESDGKHHVLIENQLEITDHKHLGQLMTYAAGLDAVTLIWISSKFTEEHRAALDWLNRITDETFKFFGIEIEVYRIGDSLPAPRFNVVAKPNDWSKVVKKNALSQAVNDVEVLRQEYWQAFKMFMENNKSSLKFQTPSHRLYYNISIGRSGFTLCANIKAKENTLSVILWLDGKNHKEHFDKLSQNCFQHSAAELGNEINWFRNDNNNSSQIFITCSADYKNREDWVNQFVWFKGNLEKFADFFKPEIEKI